eukprot:scaffold23364_cov129-Isochrysis_galbana.AAC.4
MAAPESGRLGRHMAKGDLCEIAEVCKGRAAGIVGRGCWDAAALRRHVANQWPTSRPPLSLAGSATTTACLLFGATGVMCDAVMHWLSQWLRGWCWRAVAGRVESWKESEGGRSTRGTHATTAQRTTAGCRLWL